jgi:hypothetical protein
MHTTLTGTKPPANLITFFTSLLSHTNATTCVVLLSILQRHPSGPSNADPFTTCPMHNNGHPFLPDTSDGFQALQLHVQQLHANIFLKLPTNLLISIGRTCCCPTCPSLFHGTTNLASHQHECNDFQSKSPTIPNFSSNPAWALAFAIYPASCTADLNKHINDFPDDTNPQATLPTILVTSSHGALTLASLPMSLQL